MLSTLLELLRQPTAPFREARVVDFVSSQLRTNDVPFFRDPIGNVVVGCASRSDYFRLVKRRSREPLRVYIAHMDHPGFHGVQWQRGAILRAKWHGGGPTRHLRGSTVWLGNTEGHSYRGQVRAARLTSTGRSIETLDVDVELPTTRRPNASALYGGFAFRAPVWRAARKLYTKAADDLVGVFAVLATAIEHSRRRPRTPFLGLLTRAEEVGFVGAIGHFDLGWLRAAKRPVVCISLETSRTLPNAIVGRGPVVRLGDRRTVFEPDALNVLGRIAQRILPGKHQRRMMDGGTCEATAATVYGLSAIGISVPLGNYHNQSFEGGPDSRGRGGPAPEFVHLDDIDGMLRLCRGLLQQDLPWDEPWAAETKLYKERLKTYRRLL
jgi:putative aminopeptidase FrvX